MDVEESIAVGTGFDAATGTEAGEPWTLEVTEGRDSNSVGLAWGHGQASVGWDPTSGPGDLLKRFGIENGNYDDHTFEAKGDGGVACVLDHASLKPENLDPDVVALFADLDLERGDSLIAFGWAMAEDLAKLA